MAEADVSANTWRRREAIIRQFEEAWQQGRRPEIEACLPADGLERDALLIELVHAELQYRLDAGEPARVEEYVSRYPQLEAAPVLSALVAAELRLRRRREPDLSVAEYRQRFGGRAALADPAVAATVDAAPALPASASGLGSCPGYEVLGEVGRGAMGAVYRAVQTSTRRVVALKVMLHGVFPSARARQRFEREVELAARLHSPSIVSVHECGSTSTGLPFFAMEYVEGRALDDYLRETAPPLADTLRLFATLCRAVHYAHQRGVMHRDLKPANIRIDAEGLPHILDFGLARDLDLHGAGATATRTGEFVGTPAYSSPEQVQGDPDQIDVRTDVYSLGVMLYQAVTGHDPYRLDGGLAEVFRAIAESDPVPPMSWQSSDSRCRVDEAVAAIILKALAKRREERYQSADALAADLEHYLAGEPISATPPRFALLLRLWLRRNARSGIWTIAIGIVCGALTAGTVAAPRLLPFLHLSAEAYGRFPSEPRPWLALDLPLPLWLFALLSLAGAGSFTLMGLASAQLLRTRNRWEDGAAGTATGLVSAVTALLLGLSWATILAEAVMPSRDVLLLLAAQPGDRLVEVYPDLARLPPAERLPALGDKIVADLIVGIPRGIWLGTLFTLTAFVSFSIHATMIAGHLLRRASVGTALLPYLQATVPAALLILALYLLVFYHDRVNPAPGVLMALLLTGMTILAAIGGYRHWPGLAWLALYSVSLGAMVLLLLR